MNEELVKRFQAVKPQIRGLRVDKTTNIERGTLTIGTEVVDFNKEAYLARPNLTDSQRKWGESLDSNDGFIPVVLTTEKGDKFPFNSWLSVIKGLEGVSVSGNKIVVAAGKKFKVTEGVLLTA